MSDEQEAWEVNQIAHNFHKFYSDTAKLIELSRKLVRLHDSGKLSQASGDSHVIESIRRMVFLPQPKEPT